MKSGGDQLGVRSGHSSAGDHRIAVELMRDRNVDTVPAKAVPLLRNQYAGHPVRHLGEGSAPAPR